MGKIVLLVVVVVGVRVNVFVVGVAVACDIRLIHPGRKFSGTHRLLHLLFKTNRVYENG